MNEPAPPPPRRRARRILIWIAATVGVLVLAFFLIVPPIIASSIRTKFIASVEQNLEATASVGKVSFSWAGNVSLTDVEIKDRAGAPLASVKSVKAHVGLIGALRGEYVADFQVESPRLELRRREDGRLNLATIPKPQPTNTSTNGAPSAPSTARKIPDFDAKLDVRNALLVIAGGKENSQFPISGTFTVKSVGGVISIAGNNVVNEGSVSINGHLDLRDPSPGVQPGSKADLKIDRFPLDAQMAPLLELLHPAFSIASGTLDGIMDGSVSLHYQGPLSDNGDAILDGLKGGGRIEIRDCTIDGSRLLGDLMEALSMQKREIRLKPVEFRIQAGRIVYDKAWQWTISGSETTFTGSIGLDRTLDLVWHIPVTDELAERVPVLRASKGKTIEAPIKGTVSRPKLDWKGLVTQAAEDRIEDAAKKGLEDLLGGRDENKAQKLLEEADALHKEGKTGEAAEKYRKIKDDHRKTRVYKDNRERIDPRAEEK